MKRAIYIIAVAILFAMIAAISPGGANASIPAQENPPHVFSGNATIDGNPAPQGTVVTVLEESVVIASVTVDASGTYAGLQVPTPGVTVTFTVAGLLAAETAITEIGGSSILNLTARSAGQGVDAPATPTPVPAPTNTVLPPTSASVQSAFRVGPTVRLRPVNDVVDQDQDGVVEILFRNPALNDTTMMVDLTVSIPSGIHIYGEGFATGSAAGAASGSFRVQPSQSTTVYLNIKSEKTGRFIVHFSGAYWPEGNKDLFNPVSLTHPFVVDEPSPDPFSEEPTNPSQVSVAPATAVPAPMQQGDRDPSVSCSLSPDGAGSNGAGDLALLGLPLLGLTGPLRRRRDS